MEGIVFDIKRYAVHDGPGIRTTVFFKGCPLHCLWCHNPESISREIQKYTKKVIFDGLEIEIEDTVGYRISVEDLFKEINKDIAFFDESGGGVTFSGGEPFMQTKFLKEITRTCKDNGIHVTIDTTGQTSKKDLKEVLPYVDLFLYDLKHMSDQKHYEYTGASNKKILENLRYLKENKKDIIIRVPVIPGYNDDNENIKATGNFISEINDVVKEIHLLPYHNIAEGKYQRFHIQSEMKKMKSLSEEALYPLKEQFEQMGYIVKIGG
ncbi:MAG: glycyl-radical enzyme activating protein [Chlorobi bacterium]|nr:glycyl-radical enzyme activating protein [Chlorobiota bacterium]